MGLVWRFALALAALSAPCHAEGAAPVRILAAASLTEVVQELSRGFEGAGDAPVEASFGGSSTLARQIRDGAPADLFLSASPEWTSFLREQDALVGKPIPLARNQLVCVAPRGSPLAAQGVRDLASLLEQLGGEEGVAIADEGVPAGDYARAALGQQGLLAAYRSRLVGQKDVRAVLNAVERGELEAGFVYSTEAKLAAVDLLFAFDPATHPPIEYQAAMLRDAPNPAGARRFLAYLRSEAGRAALANAGFVLP